MIVKVLISVIESQDHRPPGQPPELADRRAPGLKVGRIVSLAASQPIWASKISGVTR